MKYYLCDTNTEDRLMVVEEGKYRSEGYRNKVLDYFDGTLESSIDEIKSSNRFWFKQLSYNGKVIYDKNAKPQKTEKTVNSNNNCYWDNSGDLLSE